MKSKSQGFTLIELMVVLVIIGVLLSVAGPSMMGLLRSNTVISVNNTVVADLQYARSEAIKRNGPVTMCAADDGVPPCVVRKDWSTGWIVFAENVPVNGEVDGGEPILRSSRGREGENMTIRSRVEVGVDAVGRVTYQGEGFPLQFSDSRPPFLHFLICVNEDVRVSRRIKLNQSGRINSSGVSDRCA